MLVGSKSLAEVETLSARLSRPMRGLLGVQRRLPDTTLRSALCTVEPWQLMPALHALARQAQRRKALEPDELPFGVVSLDGKGFSIPASDDWYAQRQTHGEGAPLLGVVRSVTATLTSCSARPIIDRSRGCCFLTMAHSLRILAPIGVSTKAGDFQSCVASLTLCLRSSAASRSAATSAAPRRGKR